MKAWVYILVMAIVTYLIRALPFAAVRNKISSRFVRSLLYYMPYAVLTAMTLPDIFSSTASLISAIVGCAAAAILAYCGASLLITALAASAGALIAEILMKFI